MTRVLITGVAGFIGSHIARHCLDLGVEGVGIDDLSGGSIDNVPSGVVFREGTKSGPARAAEFEDREVKINLPTSWQPKK